ncbi:hypothetical protein HF1_08200 [Mycoplasma haemofelis str. Langford 1]|uniref:Uncharacterized protein n=2 Tax=Mycoplasma haemofelis TaxID=29501 RepID=F6FIV9_MYCHI|nr:hypothetical protein [Mycoplasma haemofelis]AEG73157.1 hypothetical protein MHF_0899 [Mycoplasma haemofelis Ohio2]CBY92828.1 hypothetical protein HF1_08200 [Mycoplasma haemofelis str. Langford 1]
MPNAVAKMTLGLAGASAASAGGVYLSGALDKEEQKFSIRELVAKNKSIVLIASEENERWEKIWTTYKTQNQGRTEDSWNLEGWNHTSTDTRLPSLSAKCTSESTIKVEGVQDKKYQDFVSWCTRKAEFKDKLIDMGYEVLGDSDAKWQTNFDSYKAANNQIKIQGLEIQTSENYNSGNNKLQTECKAALAAAIDEAKYSNSFEGIKTWCAKKKGESN